MDISIVRAIYCYGKVKGIVGLLNQERSDKDEAAASQVTVLNQTTVTESVTASRTETTTGSNTMVAEPVEAPNTIQKEIDFRVTPAS